MPSTREVRSNAARLFGYDVFVSFALGPPPRGSRSYASDLARRLRESDFTVFFSEEEAPVGDQLDSTLKRALHRSRILAVIVNRGTLADPRWVQAEVEEFRRKHPERPVIPINIGGALQDAILGPAAEPWLRFSNKIWVDESQSAGDEGVVTDGVLERFTTAPSAMRSRTRWRRTVGAAFAVLSIVTASALWFAWSDRQNASRAARNASDAQRNAMQAQTNANVARANERRANISAADAVRESTRAVAAEGQARQEAAAARLAERRAQAGRLAAESQLARPSDGRLALLLAREAFEIEPSMEARRALYAALDEPVPMWLFRAQWVDYSKLNPNTSLVYSGDGQFIATVEEKGLIHLWDAKTRREGPLLRARSEVSKIAFSADGRTLASAGQDGQVQLWDPRTRAPLGEPMTHPELAYNPGELAWSPDGKVLAWASKAGDKSWRIVLWDVKSRSPIGEPLRLDTHRVSNIAFNGDGTLLAACLFDQIDVWNVATRALVVPPIPSGIARHVSFVPAESDGGSERIAFIGQDYEVTLWNLKRNEAEHERFGGHSKSVLAFSRASQADIAATASEDTTIRFWHGTSPHLLRETLWAQQGPAFELAFSPDGTRLMANSSDGLVQWLLNTGFHRLQRGGSRSSSDGHGAVQAFVGDDAAWLVVQRTEVAGARETSMEWHDLQAGHKTVSALFDQPGHLTAVAHDGAVALIRDDQLVEIRRPDGHRCRSDKTAFDAAFSPDGRLLVSMSQEGEPAVRLWRSSDCREIATFMRGEHDPDPVTFTRDGAALLVATRAGIRRWDIAARRFVGMVDIPCALQMADDPKGRFVAGVSGCSGGDQGAVVVVRLDASAPPITLRRTEGGYDIAQIAFSPDGLWLAAAGADGFIWLWDLSVNQPAGPPIDAGQELTSLAFSGDGRTLVTARKDGSHVSWEIDGKAWAALACTLAQRNLSCAEWQRAMGRQPYRRTCAAFPTPPDAARCR